MVVLQEGTWCIYVVPMAEGLATSTVTALDGSVVIELGQDYLQCGLIDPSGATAQIFRAVKIDEARELVATAKSRPSVQAQIKGNQRVKELQQADEQRERERVERADLEAPVRAAVQQWVCRKPSLQKMLVGLEEIVPSSAQVLAGEINKLKADPTLVTRTYKKALLKLHPDKLRHQGLSAKDLLLATAVFDALKVTYEREKEDF